MSIKEIFDELSLSVIKFLESHQGVTNVHFFEIGPVKTADLLKWETTNHPYELPEDFKSFLKISDGLLLKWNMMLNTDDNIPLGKMHINSLKDIVRIPDLKGDLNPRHPNQLPVLPNSELIAFSLSSQGNGQVAFVYNSDDFFSHPGKTSQGMKSANSTNEPEIWFQDLSCHWHFIAKTFTQYFRLMVVHLGLPNWHYAFTDVGLDPISKQWFRFLSPYRLVIDIKNINSANAFQNAQKKTEKETGTATATESEVDTETDELTDDVATPGDVGDNPSSNTARSTTVAAEDRLLDDVTFYEQKGFSSNKLDLEKIEAAVLGNLKKKEKTQAPKKKK